MAVRKAVRKTDVVVANHGTIFLFAPQTVAARRWIKDYIPAGAQYFGTSLAVEHRYADNIACGMAEDGLVVA